MDVCDFWERYCPSDPEFFTGILKLAKMVVARALHATGRLVTSFFFFWINQTLLGSRPLGSLVTGSALCNIACALLFFLESMKKMFLGPEAGIEKAPLPGYTTRSSGRVSGCAVRVGRRVMVTDSVPGRVSSLLYGTNPLIACMSHSYHFRIHCSVYNLVWGSGYKNLDSYNPVTHLSHHSSLPTSPPPYQNSLPPVL